MRQLRNTLLLGIALIVLAGMSAGITTYDVALHGDSADINITVELYPDNPDRETRLTSSWLLPSGMTVDTVHDSDGELEFRRDGSSVVFETTIDRAEDKEVVHIQGQADGVVSEEYRELDLVKLQLSGFHDKKPDVPDEVTQVQLTADRPLLSASHSFGFDMALEGSTANFSGEGPVNLQLAISEGGERYEHYVLFGPGDLSTADDLYWVPAAVTGFLPQVNRWPVVVYPDETYDRIVDRWSAGQYRTGGLIFIRESTMEKESGPAVVMHEVMHGFNDQALNWFAGDRAWVAEGTAKYVEWLVNANRSVPQAEIFGERVTWSCGPRQQCSYPPRGTPDDLWDFYQQDTDFLATWAPLQSDDETRRFGYALSELIVRDYTRRNGPESMNAVYRDLRQLNTELDDEISGAAANQRLQDIMGTDFRPCDAPDREQFDRCLDKIHAMEPVIPPLGDVGGGVEQVRIEPIEDPKEQPGAIIGNRTGLPGDGRVLGAVSGFFRDIAAGLEALFNSLFGG